MRSLHLLAVLLPLPLTGPARSADCDKVLGTHGFKATAQVVCHFGQVENQGLDWARSCARHQDPGLNMMEIRQGAEVFQATARQMGKVAACENVFQRFGDVFYRR